MKKNFHVGVLVALVLFVETSSQKQENFRQNDVLNRAVRDTKQTNADQMVQNILQWLQGVYTQNSRRVRQGTLREYLPPVNTQKPRPFQPINNGIYLPPNQPGYAPAGITPQPPFPTYTNPVTGGITGDGDNGYSNSVKPQPPFTVPTGYPTGPTGPPTGYPTSGYPSPGYPTGYPTPRPSIPTGYPTDKPSPFPTEGPTGVPTGYPTEKPSPFPSVYPTGSPTGYPTGVPTGYPTGIPTGYPTGRPTGYPTGRPTGYPTGRPTDYPSEKPSPFPTGPPPTGYPTQEPSGTPTQQPTGYPTRGPQTPSPTQPPLTSRPITNEPTEHFTSPTVTPEPKPPSPDVNTVIPTGPTDTGTSKPSPTDDDDRHPPHIHAIDVQCAKDMMTITIEFNRVFNGVIYSKGYFSNPECRYVQENSGQIKYTFTVSLNSCGTEFINAFDTQGQSYLENVLVLQNEAGIQEVWDTIRSVRCLWEGNLKESLSVALSVGMLTQEIVTFSGDTAMAKLDIQLGKGPFAPTANGLVKIGETMTLVVSVTGDPGFDIQVKDCRAKDSTGDNVVALTDDEGCVLKPKLFGAFQKTRNTGNTGASIIAYAFFSAFKFPDAMDLMIECNIELCKTDCDVCPNTNQPLEPGRRRRRDLFSGNQTLGEPVTMGKHLRVILPEDLTTGETIINLNQIEGVCMSTQNFVFSSALLVSLLTASSLFSAYLWLKNQRLNFKQ